MPRSLRVFVVALALASCGPGKQVTNPPAPRSSLVADGKLWASFFQQRSAEYRALCQQAFNIARLRVDEASSRQTLRPMAIITDIDETFLDNSPYAVHQALQGKDYEPASWATWTAKGIADTLQGAVPFFRYAAAKGMHIFYITNRGEEERAGTMANLRRFGFPSADDQHLIMRKDVSSKEQRRLVVADSYDIVLLLGDNLADFSQLFDKKTEEERKQNVLLSAAEFGQRFIILPNASYGGWEESFYRFNFKITDAAKDSMIRSSLRNY